MNNLQLGIDIATSFSIIGTAIFFVYNYKKANEEKRKKHINDLRTQQMTLVIKSLVEKLEEGYNIDEKIKMLIAEKNTEYVPRMAYDFGKSLEIKMLVYKNSELAIWGSDFERKKISEMIEITKEWYMSIFKKPIPLSNLLDNIKSTIQDIAQEIRNANV